MIVKDYFSEFITLGYGNELFMQKIFKTIQSNEHTCCKNNETSFPLKCFVGNLIHNFGKT